MRPHRRPPTRPHRPWDSPGKNTGVGCHFLIQCMQVKVKSPSRNQLLATPWTAGYQDPPSMRFSRQEYWSGLPLPSPNVSVSHPVMSDSCNSMDCSPPGFSVHGIPQARILDWVSISFSRGLPDPGIKPTSPALQADSLLSGP